MPWPADLNIETLVASLPPTADIESLAALSATGPDAPASSSPEPGAPTIATLQQAADLQASTQATLNATEPGDTTPADAAAQVRDLHALVKALRDELAAHDAQLQAQLAEAINVNNQQLAALVASAIEVTIVIAP